MTIHRHNHEDKRKFCKWAMPVLAVLVLTGCGFDAKGTGIPEQPGLGCYDLDPIDISIVDEPDADFKIDGVLFENEPFSLSWNVCYERGTNQDALTTDPYTTRLRIFSEQDGELVESFLDENFPSDAIATEECRDEEFYIAYGLPAGTYRAFAILDTDDVVYECPGLAYSFTNTVEVAFVVAASPADDLELIAPESQEVGGPDDSFQPNDELAPPAPEDDGTVRNTSSGKDDDSDEQPPARTPTRIGATSLGQADPGT